MCVEHSDGRQFCWVGWHGICPHAGLASTALVLSIAAPFGGQNWYYLTLLSPLSGAYYWQRGTRQEEMQVRVTLRLSLRKLVSTPVASH